MTVLPKRRRWVFLGIWVLIAVFGTPAQGARLIDLHITNSQEYLLLYLKLEDSFTGPIQKAVASGVPTTFSYYISLYQGRQFWADKTVAEITLTHTIKYNNLKNEFAVYRSWVGEEPVLTRSFDEAKRLMTEVAGFKLLSLKELEKGEQYQIQVKAKLSKMTLPFYLHYLLVMASKWEFETDWHTIDFEF